MKTKANTVHLADLHFEHKMWLNELQFYREEIATFEKRLGEVVMRWTDKEVLAELEHYQNQFIREKNVAIELIHDTKAHEDFLSAYAQEHPVAIDHVSFSDHINLRERVFRFREIFSSVKQDFMRWLVKVM